MILGAGVIERQQVAFRQRSRPRNAHFPPGQVKLQCRLAGMVHVEQVRVQIDDALAGGFHARVRPAVDKDVVGDAGEMGAGGKRNERYCIGAERFVAFDHLNQSWVAGLFPH